MIANRGYEAVHTTDRDDFAQVGFDTCAPLPCVSQSQYKLTEQKANLMNIKLLILLLVGFGGFLAISQSRNAKAQSQHWAYVKPVRPALPAVKLAAWPRNEIDRFVLARLEREGLTPAPAADKAILLRRVYLDLIGLPPSVKNTDDFLADPTPNAYEKVVERLLADPHYGERWARPWLDLARYADSNGFVQDVPRVMWLYRDWVIKALNDDMPFDQFTREQLAGDLLPHATDAQRVATGFHRNTLLNMEGGIDIEEARWETLVDRANTTATVWLGTTLACAQCHNHKYDPLSQRDYYRWLAFFDNTEYRVAERAYFDRNIEEPELDFPTPAQAARRTELNDEIAQFETQLKTQMPALDAAQAQWEREVLAVQNDWRALVPSEFRALNGATLSKQTDDSLLASGANAEEETYVVTAAVKAEKIAALRLEALPDERLPKGGPGRNPYGNFQLTGFEVEADGKPLKFSAAAVDNSSGKFDSERFVKGESAPWVVDATRDAQRFKRQAVFVLAQPLIGAKTLTIKLKHTGRIFGQNIGRFRLSVTANDDALKLTTITAKLRPLLEQAQRTEAQRKELATLYRGLAPALATARKQLAELREALKLLAIPSALVLQERDSFERPSTLFRERGAYLSPAGRVYAATPAALSPWPEDAAYNRLGLARWLTDERNPLTARVAVNRAWEQFFGRGLVETSEDFGTQSALPSHPELLDWLATEFMGVRSAECGVGNSDCAKPWSTKHLHRLIVTSATYRQSSAQKTPHSALRTPHFEDPDNRLLARGPRFRIEAEMVRDVALTASGLLSRKLGGPSVFPAQLPAIYATNYIGDKWVESIGEDRYRRSLYTFWRRTAPYAQFVTFDATTRESCTVRRVRTNTPLQALTLLNDEAMMEMARALAQRMQTEAMSKDAASIATYGFRLCRTRAPQAAEVAELVKLYEDQLAHFKQQPVAAAQVTKKQADATFAAWTMVANVLLNLDGTITKE